MARKKKKQTKPNLPSSSKFARISAAVLALSTNKVKPVALSGGQTTGAPSCSPSPTATVAPPLASAVSPPSDLKVPPPSGFAPATDLVSPSSESVTVEAGSGPSPAVVCPNSRSRSPGSLPAAHNNPPPPVVVCPNSGSGSPGSVPVAQNNPPPPAVVLSNSGSGSPDSVPVAQNNPPPPRKWTNVLCNSPPLEQIGTPSEHISGVPFVLIPDETIEEAKEEFKDFIFAQFQGKPPEMGRIIGVVNALWARNSPRIFVHHVGPGSYLLRVVNPKTRAILLGRSVWNIAGHPMFVSP